MYSVQICKNVSYFCRFVTIMILNRLSSDAWLIRDWLVLRIGLLHSLWDSWFILLIENKINKWIKYSLSNYEYNIATQIVAYLLKRPCFISNAIVSSDISTKQLWFPCCHFLVANGVKTSQHIGSLGEVVNIFYKEDVFFKISLTLKHWSIIKSIQFLNVSVFGDSTN